MATKRKQALGGTTAPVGGTGASLGPSKQRGRSPLKKAQEAAQKGMRRLPLAPAGGGAKKNSPIGDGVIRQFNKHFKQADPEEKHKIVQSLMNRKFGGEPWQKKVYGKDFKPGTVGKLNNEVKQDRTKSKALKGTIQKLQDQLQTTTDEDKAAIEKHLASLQDQQQETVASLGSAKESRDKFLGVRDKALGKIAAEAKQNPRAMAKSRKKLVEDKLKGTKEKKESNGGVTAQ